jgi:hypothetical protein
MRIGFIWLREGIIWGIDTLLLQNVWLEYFFQFSPAVLIAIIIVGLYFAYGNNQGKNSEKKKKKKSKYPDFEMDLARHEESE